MVLRVRQILVQSTSEIIPKSGLTSEMNSILMSKH